MTTPSRQAETNRDVRRNVAQHTTALRRDSGKTPSDPGDAHIGATEDQMHETVAPAGDEFEDEPKQG